MAAKLLCRATTSNLGIFAMKMRPLLLGYLFCMTGTVHSHPGEHEQLERIDNAIAQQPRQQQQALYIMRGSINTEGGHYDQAITDFERAEKLGPAVEVALARGMLYYQMQEFERSRVYLDRYIQRYPDAASAYEYRARTARAAGDIPRAIADLTRYFELQERPHPGNYLAAANMLQELHETGRAIKLLDQGLDKLGINPQLQRRAIELAVAQGQIADAITRLESLRLPLRDSPAWKLEMVTLLMLDKSIADARQLLTTLEVELGERRPTPARLAMLQQARGLREKLSTPIAANTH
jgi:tetratricopeptide (TPR) repeat protein